MKQTEPDLFVDPDGLKNLAKYQDRASGRTIDGRDGISGLVGGLRKDHGLICSELVSAMQGLQEARAAAASNTAEVSALLADNLNTAAANYAAADEQTGGNLDRQVRR